MGKEQTRGPGRTRTSLCHHLALRENSWDRFCRSIVPTLKINAVSPCLSNPFTGRVLSPMRPVPLAFCLLALRASTIDFPRQAWSGDLHARKGATNRPRCFLWRSPAKFFGSYAERELSFHSVGQTGASNQFKLSDGDVCDLAQQTCWMTAGRSKNVSKRAQQANLFGSNGSPGKTARSNPPKANRSCEFARGKPWPFRGSCQAQSARTSKWDRLQRGLSEWGTGDTASSTGWTAGDADANNVPQGPPRSTGNRNGAVALPAGRLQLSTPNPSWENQGPQGAAAIQPNQHFSGRLQAPVR